NCGALPDTLLETELFGHKRGAFSGAVNSRVGLFEAADGGTLFLDEIGEMSPAMQVRLLRVLDSGEVRRVGEERAFNVDARIVAAPAQTPLVSLQEMERQYVERVLQSTAWNKAQAARVLEVDIKTLNKKIRDFNIVRPA